MDLTKFDIDTINMLLKIGKRICLKYIEILEEKRPTETVCKEILCLKERENRLIEKLDYENIDKYLDYIEYIRKNFPTKGISNHTFQRISTMISYNFYQEAKELKLRLFCSDFDIQVELLYFITMEFIKNLSPTISYAFKRISFFSLCMSPHIEEKILKQSLIPSEIFIDTKKIKLEMLTYKKSKEMRLPYNMIEAIDNMYKLNNERIDNILKSFFDSINFATPLRDNLDFIHNFIIIKANLAALPEKERKAKYKDIFEKINAFTGVRKGELNALFDECIRDIEENVVPRITPVSFKPQKKI